VVEPAEHRARDQHALLDRVAIILHHRIGVLLGEDAVGDQAVGIDGPRGRVSADLFVHHRLGHRGLVRLVVTETPVTDQVDDDVLVELVAEVQRHARDEDDRLRIVAVDVEDRRLNHLGHIGAVERGARVERVAGREADLVVDDDVDRAAGGVAARLGELQRLHDHALAGKGRVAVDEHGQDLIAAAVVAPALACAHRALDDRVDDLQMRGVEAQHQMDDAAGGIDVGREPHVILHVAGHLTPVHLDPALELVEDVLRRLAEDVGQHAETPAMGHADDQLLLAFAPGALDQLVQQRDEGIAAFQREALLADIPLVEIFLETFGGGQEGQEPAPIGGVELGCRAISLEPLLNPAFLLGIGDVHVLRADRPQ
jgi:hypothetical protein